MKMVFKKPFTVEQAEEILRRAKLECGHTNVVFQRGREPGWLELAEKPNGWAYLATCSDCDAKAVHETSSPICVKCSTADGPEIMRLVTTKNDLDSKYGKVFVFTCNKCMRNEEVTFKSGY